jgi:hypothetical protein
MAIKYVFSINAGRSGSDYLTALLHQATNAASVHEGSPIMIGEPMQLLNQGDEVELRALMPLKLKQIRKKGKNGNRIYCETNSSYIRGWGYLLPDTYIPQEQIGVIILHRDVEKTAYSLLRIHEVPGASEWSRLWWLTPGAQRNVSQPDLAADPYDLCKWYVEEVRLRAKEYKERFPRITYVECALEQLNDYDFVVEVFETFGLTPSPKLKDVVGQPINLRTDWPRLPLDELLAPTGYPSADSLELARRDALLARLVAWLHENKTAEMATMKLDQTGSYWEAAVELVACTEHELEEAFQVELKFTEMEWVLIHELLYSIDPHDISFAAITRSPPPGVSYRYNFNLTVDLRMFVRRLGLKGVLATLLKVLRLTVGDALGQDYTHHAAESPL